jgi:hypothetical protein
MNADVRRQARENSGQLFDVTGPTSLGSLPRGKIVERIDTITVTSVGDVNNVGFAIGAITRTEAIPDSVLIRGGEEFVKRSAMSKGVPEFLQSTNDNPVIPAPQGEHIGNIGGGLHSVGGEGNGFLNQGLANPTRRTI